MNVNCSTCETNLAEDDTVRGVGLHAGRLVHLDDYGPGHHQVAAHLVSPGHRDGYRHGGLSRPAQLLGPMPPEAMQAWAASIPGWLFWADVSKWQGRSLDDSYIRPFVMYRLTLSTTIVDSFGHANTTWAHKRVAQAGAPLIGHGGYHVWYPGNEEAQAAKFLAAAALDPLFVAMIDVESWSGAITGDHSGSVTKLATILADHLSPARVKVYGNGADLASIYPGRPSWLGVIRAAYRATPPPQPWQAWQFTDGAAQWSRPVGWPLASAPFGACDHNAFNGAPADLLAAFGLNPGGLLNLDADAQRYIAQQADRAATAAAELVHNDQTGDMTRSVTILADAVQTLSRLNTVLTNLSGLQQAITALPDAIAKAVAAQVVAAGGSTADPSKLAAAIAPHLNLTANE